MQVRKILAWTLLCISFCSGQNQISFLTPSQSDVVNLGVDERFSIQVVIGQGRLNGLSTFMNTAYFAQKLAQEDFRGVLRETDAVSLARWDNVKIQFAPLSPSCERRYLIWGLYQGLHFLADHGFVQTTCILRWNQVEVGVFKFELSNPPSGLGNSNTSNITSQDLGTTIYQSYFKPKAQTLSLSGVYISLVAAMLTSAERGSHNTVVDYAVDQPEFGPMYLGVENTALAKSPPNLFTNAKAIATFWEAVQWVTTQRRWAEYNTNCIENRNLIGIVRLRKGRPIVSIE